MSIFDGVKDVHDLYTQAVTEVVYFWDAYTSEELQERDETAYKIVLLVVVSEDADAVFKKEGKL